MLTQSDKENILLEFPNIKLSYENMTYKKVYNADYIVAIPEGIKCFAWFTHINEKSVCLIMELTTNKQISDIKVISVCFSRELSYGTILYGTVFYHANNRFFTIEDIFSYKGNDIYTDNWGEKMIKINNMLKNDFKQISYNKSFIVFGLPVMYKSNDEFVINNLQNIKYKIETIQFKLFNKVNMSLCMNYNSYINDKSINNNHPINNNHTINNQNKYVKREFVFLIKPDVQNDIYYLYGINDELKEEQQGIAHIPDYNTSVMMNKLFRIIKENNNLDALEESDDEDEFENENTSKFVHLDKSYKMICQYNHKFKKWCPLKLADDHAKITTNQDLKSVYKIYEQNKEKNKYEQNKEKNKYKKNM